MSGDATRIDAPPLTPGMLRRLRRQALRLCRHPDDADDLVQETLLAACSAGRHDLPWLSGVLRRQAALAARTGIRRRRREAGMEAQACAEEPVPRGGSAGRRAWLATLPPSARRVAVLALHGLSADEIRWILRLPSTAFRQRLTRLRQGVAQLEPTLREDLQALAAAHDRPRAVDLPFGLARRALKDAMQVGEGLGTHDEDGHLILIDGRAHTSPPRGNHGTGSPQEDTPC